MSPALPARGGGSQKKAGDDQHEGDFVRNGHRGNNTRFHVKGKLPEIVLILETDADLKYWDHLREPVDALDEKGVSIQLWRIGPGEKEPTQIPPTGPTDSPQN